MKKMFPILFFFALVSASGQQIVDNEKMPQNNDAGRVLKLEEVLRIAGDGDDYYYNGINIMHIDTGGNIYINDAWTSRDRSHLLKFSPEGTFLSDLYRQGEGPGEIQSMYEFFLADEKVYVFDFTKRKIVVMEEEGTFLWEQKIESEFLNDFIGVFEDWLVFLQKDNPSERRTSRLYDIGNVIVFLSKDGQTEKDVFTFTNQTFFITLAQGGGGMGWDPFISTIGDGKLFVCSSREYLVEVLDLKTGEVTNRFRRPYPRVRHEMQDYEKMFASKYSAPKRRFKNDIVNLFYNGGNLWVKTSTESEDKGQLFDVFDTEGRFLDSFFINTKGRIVKIDGHFIYSAETDEEELPYLIKYRIVN